MSVGNLPGIGGSIGMCPVCGKGFLAEILLGKSVPQIEIVGLEPSTHCVHDKCNKLLKKVQGKSYELLPDGPLKAAYAKAHNAAAPPA